MEIRIRTWHPRAAKLLLFAALHAVAAFAQFGVILTSGQPAPFTYPAVRSATLFFGGNGYGYRIVVPPGATSLEVRVTDPSQLGVFRIHLRFENDIQVMNGQAIADYNSPSEGSDIRARLANDTSPRLRPGTYYIAIGVITTGRATSGTITATFAGPCTYSVSPTNISLSSLGGSGKIYVTTANGCAWTVASSSSWLTINPTGGKDSLNVGFSVPFNATGEARTAQLTAGGQSITVTQEGAIDSGLAVANAGFETPSVSVHAYNPAGSGWTFSAAAPFGLSGSGVLSNITPFIDSSIPCCYSRLSNAQAPEGAQAGFVQGMGTITQTIEGFRAGTPYILSFLMGQRVNHNAASQQILDIVLDGNTVLGTFTVPLVDPAYRYVATAPFVTTAGRHTLAFVGKATRDATAFIDNVRVAPKDPTPAPASVTIRSGLKVLPFFFVPSDETAPTALQQSSLMKHLVWAQERYRDLLSGRDAFELATDQPDVYFASNTTSYYKQPDNGAGSYVDELLRFKNFSRVNSPYVFLVIFMSPNVDFPTGGGRPLNGWLNEGGGVAILSSFSLDRDPSFQAALRHELGHAFGLIHVDAYGYSMATNNSIMSYNPAHWTNFFEESATPGILIPEDIRALAFNKLAFPSLTFLDTDTLEGYRISYGIFTLPPMPLPNRPPYNLPNQFFSAESVNQIASAGQNARFTASVSGIASPGFQWRLNNVPVPDANGPSLFIKDARPADAGTYSVTVTGGAAPAISNLGTLAILKASTLELYVPADDSAGTLTVTGASAATAWNASSDALWITITSPTSGTGSAGVGYSVTANDTASDRTGTLSIAGQTFTVMQARRAP